MCTFLRATAILLTACLPHHLNSVNLQGWSHLFEREHRGASLPRAAELRWLRSSSAGAQRSWAAHNSPSSTSYSRAASQSPSPVNFRAIHLLELSNISQAFLLHTLESHPILFITFLAVTKSALHVLCSLPLLSCMCWESNEKSSAKCTACAWRVVSKLSCNFGQSKITLKCSWLYFFLLLCWELFLTLVFIFYCKVSEYAG